MQIKSKFHHGGIRTHGPTLLVAFEGYHQSTGARPYKPAPKEGHEVRIGDLSDAWNGQNSTISRKVHLTVQPVCPSYLMVIDKRRLRLPPPPLSTNSLFFYLLLIWYTAAWYMIPARNFPSLISQTAQCFRPDRLVPGTYFFSPYFVFLVCFTRLPRLDSIHVVKTFWAQNVSLL